VNSESDFLKQYTKGRLSRLVIYCQIPTIIATNTSDSKDAQTYIRLVNSITFILKLIRETQQRISYYNIYYLYQYIIVCTLCYNAYSNIQASSISPPYFNYML